jgi:membrane protease YdiL (CAAX protease family)
MIVLAGVAPLVKTLPKLPSLILLSTIATIATYLLTRFFLRKEKLQLKDTGAEPNKNSFKLVLFAFTLGLLLPILHAAIVMLSGHVELKVVSSLSPTPVLLTLLLYSIAACREELAFRGYPLRSLDYAIGPWAAQTIVAFIFGIEHFIINHSWQSFVGPFIGSLYFGIAALRTKGLAVPIGLHAAWNFGQWILGFKGEAGIWQVVVEKGYDLSAERIGMISYFLVMSLGIAAIHFYYKRLKQNEGNLGSDEPAIMVDNSNSER